MSKSSKGKEIQFERAGALADLDPPPPNWTSRSKFPSENGPKVQIRSPPLGALSLADLDPLYELTLPSNFNRKSGYLHINHRTLFRSFIALPANHFFWVLKHGNCKQHITVLCVEAQMLINFTKKLPRLKPKIRCISLVF